MAERCSKHKMYYQPCIICAEIDQLKSSIEEKEESIERMHNQLNELQESHHCQGLEKIDLQTELDEMSIDLEKAINATTKSYDPTARIKLSVNDMIMVRGVFVANSFLFNSLDAIGKCIENKKDQTTKNQLMLIKNDLAREWDKVVGLLRMFEKEFSDHNWNRMVKEVNKIVQIAVGTMNQRDLGCFMVTKEGEYISQEYTVRPLVEKAIETAIHSAGTNSLTAYSKEELIKSIVKIVEEK